jgi:hypothetical protein
MSLVVAIIDAIDVESLSSVFGSTIPQAWSPELHNTGYIKPNTSKQVSTHASFYFFS